MALTMPGVPPGERGRPERVKDFHGFLWSGYFPLKITFHVLYIPRFWSCLAVLLIIHHVWLPPQFLWVVSGLG